MDVSRDAGVLAGLRVIELSAFVAVPLGGMTLAQLGADVIRIDPLGGGLDRHRWPVTADGSSLYWAGLNKGKRSVTVDLRQERGRSLVRRLIAASGADGGIVVTNLSPRWLSFDELRADRSDVILVELAGNPDGTIAVDYTVNAATGYPQVTGPGAGVVNHVLPAWDVAAGNLVATAVLAAERWRSRTGEGTLVRLSLADVAFATVAHLGHVAEVVVNDEDRPSHGNFVYGTFGRDFATRDGHRVMVVAVTPRQWRALVTATETGREMSRLEAELGLDFEREGDRFEGREAISAVLEEWFARRPSAEAGAALDRHRVCWGPYRSFRGLVEDDPRLHPDLNPVWSVVDQPGVGPYPMPTTPLAFSAVPRLPPRPAPILGGDTDEVLRELLGLSGEDVASLGEEGLI